jgi:hypothetical protein
MPGQTNLIKEDQEIEKVLLQKESPRINLSILSIIINICDMFNFNLMLNS